MPAVLDTHVAIWYLLDTKNLSEAVFSLIDGARLRTGAFLACTILIEPPRIPFPFMQFQIRSNG